MTSRKNLTMARTVAIWVAISSLCFQLPGQAHAQELVVDAVRDGHDATLGDSICDDGHGNCTLRAAVEEANVGPIRTIRLPAAKIPLARSSPDLQVSGDLTIIGAGPSGLFGAFYGGLREMKVKVIDALDDVGGQLTALYPEKFIYDVPGYPKVLSIDLVKHLFDQAAMFKPTIALGERVEKLEKQADGAFTLTTNKGEHHSRRARRPRGRGAESQRGRTLGAL